MHHKYQNRYAVPARPDKSEMKNKSCLLKKARVRTKFARVFTIFETSLRPRVWLNIYSYDPAKCRDIEAVLHPWIEPLVQLEWLENFNYMRKIPNINLPWKWIVGLFCVEEIANNLIWAGDSLNFPAIK